MPSSISAVTIGFTPANSRSCIFWCMSAFCGLCTCSNEILDTAERLFGTKGFDGTSTTDILNEIGIARGTLYYHFKSKEDILDAMIERMTGSLVAKASEIAGKKDAAVPRQSIEYRTGIEHCHFRHFCRVIRLANSLDNAFLKFRPAGRPFQK